MGYFIIMGADGRRVNKLPGLINYLGVPQLDKGLLPVSGVCFAIQRENNT
jgi:hypothetical protein